MYARGRNNISGRTSHGSNSRAYTERRRVCTLYLDVFLAVNDDVKNGRDGSQARNQTESSNSQGRRVGSFHGNQFPNYPVTSAGDPHGLALKIESKYVYTVNLSPTFPSTFSFSASSVNSLGSLCQFQSRTSLRKTLGDSSVCSYLYDGRDPFRHDYWGDFSKPFVCPINHNGRGETVYLSTCKSSLMKEERAGLSPRGLLLPRRACFNNVQSYA